MVFPGIGMNVTPGIGSEIAVTPNEVRCLGRSKALILVDPEPGSEALGIFRRCADVVAMRQQDVI